MNHYNHLYKQVKRCILAEADMTPEERACHQWQFLATIGPDTILVGKGGANTMFFRQGEGEFKYDYPERMLNFLKSLGSDKFSTYVVVSPDTKAVVKRSTELDTLLSKIPPVKKFKKYRIFGIKSDGSSVPLHELRKSMTGCKWVSLKK